MLYDVCYSYFSIRDAVSSYLTVYGPTTLNKKTKEAGGDIVEVKRRKCDKLKYIIHISDGRKSSVHINNLLQQLMYFVSPDMSKPINTSTNTTTNGTNSTRSSEFLRKDSVTLKIEALDFVADTEKKMDVLSELENHRNLNTRYWYRLALRCSLPDTPLDKIVRRSSFILMSTLTCGAGIIWGLMYLLLLDEPRAATYPFTYSVLMTNCFVFFAKEGRYHDIVFMQLFLILILPICMHLEVGGIVKSGCVIIWSFLCPLGAALFCDPRTAQKFFLLYVMCMITTITSEQWSSNMRNHSGRTHTIGFIEVQLFTMNIIGAMTITFLGALTFSARLDIEYNRSEKLLYNVLPKSIARRLKEGESHIVDHFEGVTILFVDLVGFTRAAAEFHPNFLVGSFLKDVFSSWDEICDQHEMEKIKTIGDAFMVVGGIDDTSARSGDDIACAMIKLGIDMQKTLHQINNQYGLNFEIRVGLHSGPVIAGVIGVRKFAFDVWGDAVNTASRMESHGVPSHIHMSHDTYVKVKELLSDMNIKCRGKIDVKGKGDMLTYLLKLPKAPPCLQHRRRNSFIGRHRRRNSDIAGKVEKQERGK